MQGEPPPHPLGALLGDIGALTPVLDQLDVGIAITNMRGAFVYANPRASAILGVDQATMLTRTVFETAWGVLDESEAPVPVDQYPACVTLLQGRPLHDVVIGLPGAEGALVWLAVTTSLLQRSGGGDPHAMVITFTDVTRRKQAEQLADHSNRALARQQALTERIIHEAPLGIGFMDRDLVFRWANPTLARFLGVTVERMRDQHVFELFPEAREQFGALMTGVLETGVVIVRPTTLNRTVKRKDKQLITDATMYRTTTTDEPL